jgi:hypothetical protein
MKNQKLIRQQIPDFELTRSLRPARSTAGFFMRCYNAAMKEVAHMLLALIFFGCWLLAARSWFIGVINSFRAGANRRPGFGWHLMMSGVILGRDIFTERGEQLADRARSGISGFLIFWFLGFMVGLLWNATAP